MLLQLSILVKIHGFKTCRSNSLKTILSVSVLSEIFSHKSETAVGKLIYEYSVLTVDMYVLVCLYFGEK